MPAFVVVLRKNLAANVQSVTKIDLVRRHSIESERRNRLCFERLCHDNAEEAESATEIMRTEWPRYFTGYATYHYSHFASRTL